MSSDSFFLDSADVAVTGGLFLKSDLLLNPGERLEVEFRVPGHTNTIRRFGRVVRAESEYRALGPGIAVALEDLSRSERRALEQIPS